MRGAWQQRTMCSTLRVLLLLSFAVLNAILWIDLLFLLLFSIFARLAYRGFCWTIVVVLICILLVIKVLTVSEDVDYLISKH